MMMYTSVDTPSICPMNRSLYNLCVLPKRVGNVYVVTPDTSAMAISIHALTPSSIMCSAFQSSAYSVPSGGGALSFLTVECLIPVMFCTSLGCVSYLDCSFAYEFGV